jgi:hypothetical protein
LTEKSTIARIIIFVIVLYITGAVIPQALTALATSALTSVNAGVQTLFQIVISIIGVIAVILIHLRSVGVTVTR